MSERELLRKVDFETPIGQQILCNESIEGIKHVHLKGKTNKSVTCLVGMLVGKPDAYIRRMPPCHRTVIRTCGCCHHMFWAAYERASVEWNLGQATGRRRRHVGEKRSRPQETEQQEDEARRRRGRMTRRVGGLPPPLHVSRRAKLASTQRKLYGATRPTSSD